MLVPRQPHIGTLREKPLHASLKRWYARPGDRIEVPVGGYVIDLVRDDVLIEIQTRGFSSMKSKVAALLEAGHAIRIVHSIPVDRWIVKIDGDTELSRRRSPKHGHVTDVFGELVGLSDHIAHPGLSIEVLMTIEEECRHHQPGKAWRRNGWVVDERRLVEVLESIPLDDVADLVALLPRDLPEPFTTTDIAAGLGRPRRIGQQMAYCLRAAGAIEMVGKQGNSIEYAIT